MTEIACPDTAHWRKSSRSYGGGNCIEVASCLCDADPGFRKAAGSMANGNCAEVGNAPAGVLVRDTKDRDGTVLAYPATTWRAFLADMKAGAA